MSEQARPEPDAGPSLALEQATGLSLADVEALQADPSPEIRSRIAIKFGRQFDRLNHQEAQKIATTILGLLIKDRHPQVRRSLARTVAASTRLPHGQAMRLALDEIEVAWPVLERSPVLEDRDLLEIIQTRPDPHAQAIAGRRHLSGAIASLLAAQGSLEVALRLVDNRGAEIPEAALLHLLERAGTEAEIGERLEQRPGLPPEIVQRFVANLGNRLKWQPLLTRRMARGEARRLRVLGGDPLSRNPMSPGQLAATAQALYQRFCERDLSPEDLLQFTRDGDVDKLEIGFAILCQADLRRVRRLLYGADKRGMVALCIKAGFTTPHYLALRMAIGLAEQGAGDGSKEVSYGETTFDFAREQYERLRADQALLQAWFPPES